MLLTARQSSLEERRANPASAPTGRDHTCQLDDVWGEGIQPDEPDQPVFLPPKQRVNPVTGLQRRPFQLQAATIEGDHFPL